MQPNLENTRGGLLGGPSGRLVASALLVLGLLALLSSCQRLSPLVFLDPAVESHVAKSSADSVTFQVTVDSNPSSSYDGEYDQDFSFDYRMASSVEGVTVPEAVTDTRDISKVFQVTVDRTVVTGAEISVPITVTVTFRSDYEYSRATQGDDSEESWDNSYELGHEMTATGLP